MYSINCETTEFWCRKSTNLPFFYWYKKPKWLVTQLIVTTVQLIVTIIQCKQLIPGSPLLPHANWWGIFKFALSPTDNCTIPKSK